MSSPRSSGLVYDLIARVMELSRDDYALLFHSSLVNWEFNRAASRMLYSRVVVSPHFKPVLNLRDTNPIPESSNFISASLPRNAQYVLSLEISGYISSRPPPRNMLYEMIASAIKTFVNLGSVRFVPKTYHEELFVNTLPALLDLHSLTELIVNASCSDDARAPLLVKLGGLRKLTLFNPGRAILQLLPDWLGRLSRTLVQLHLKNNCGSVTPGVLKSFIPHIKDNLRAFTLGLSYSLTDDDVFTFLGNLPHLERLNLRYYWQLKHPPRQPKLTSLRSFTAIYSRIHSKHDVREFSKWVRRAIAGSPRLEELRLTRGDDSDWSHTTAYDGLVDHIVAKHSETIRVLDFGAALVGVGKLKAVLKSCVRLEEVSVAADRSALTVFFANSSCMTRLRSASFQISNTKKAFRVDDADIAKMMQTGPPSLRRLSVNDVPWEAFWIVNTDDNTHLVVQHAEDQTPPWYRKTDV
ncbi:hypothetical protein BDZ97DRAFT_1797828 [Flammula alnicola]|nr:hypothetical protein BDZ97DRAFT_1797828 [Flammula alnicola]